MYSCWLTHGQINFPSTIRSLLSNVQWKFLKDKTIIDDAKQCMSPKNEVNKLLISMTHQVFQLGCANNANPLIFLFFTCKASLKFWCITLYIYIREFAYEQQVFLALNEIVWRHCHANKTLSKLDNCWTTELASI